MFFRYGTLTAPANAADIHRRATMMRSPQGIPYAQEWNWDCTITLIATGQAACAAAELAMSQALGRAYQDAAFLDDNGAVIWSLPNATSLDGVVIENYDNPVTAGMFATSITANFTVKAKYQFGGSGPLLLSFQESLSVTGGGPRYGFVECVDAIPQKHLINPKTVCHATQQGSATMLGSQTVLVYPNAPGPIWPSDEMPDLREIKKSFSRDGNGMFQGTIDWRYEFAAAGPIAGDPRRGI